MRWLPAFTLVLAFAATSCVAPGAFDEESNACPDPMFDSTARSTYCGGSYATEDVAVRNTPDSNALTLIASGQPSRGLQYTPGEATTLWSLGETVEESQLPPLDAAPLHFASLGNDAVVVDARGRALLLTPQAATQLTTEDATRCGNLTPSGVTAHANHYVLHDSCGLALVDRTGSTVAFHTAPSTVVTLGPEDKLFIGSDHEIRQTSISTILAADPDWSELPTNEDRGRRVASFEGRVESIHYNHGKLAVVEAVGNQRTLHLGDVEFGEFIPLDTVSLDPAEPDTTPTYQIGLPSDFLTVLRTTRRNEFVNVQILLFDTHGNRLTPIPNALPQLTKVSGTGYDDLGYYVGISDRVLRYDLKIQ